MPKRIGIIGGLSPESTVEYYLHLTHTYTQRFGTAAYPEVIIYSVSFQSYADWPAQGRWDLVARGLGEAARKLEAAGADFIVISANTMHMVVNEVRLAVHIPVLSLLDVVAGAVDERGFKTVGLLGTRYTMEQAFFPKALSARGIRTLVPEGEERQYINRVIYDELVKGIIKPESRQGFIEIIQRLGQRGAEGVILGCTEIPLLVSEADSWLPLFNTTTLHAEAALEYALKE
jgi:aspartate racemase